MHAPPARNASCRTVNASGDASEQVPSVPRTSLSEHVARSQTDDALGFERAIELVVHDASVADDDQPGVLTDLRRDRPATRGALDARRVELARRHRPVAVEVELADAAVAPDLVAVGRPLDARRARSTAARRRADEPVGTAERRRGVGGERAGTHPEVFAVRRLTRPRPPCSARSSRLSSTAYSIGSVLVIGSMNPLTIIAVACCSVSPRDCR